MALVQAGKPFSHQDIKYVAGDLAGRLRQLVQQCGDYKVQLESWPDVDLIELGLAQDEINAIKGFFIGDLPAIQNALAASQWIKQLLGLGVIGYSGNQPLPPSGALMAPLMPPPPSEP